MKSRIIAVERGKAGTPNVPTDHQIAPPVVLLYQTLMKPVEKELLVSIRCMLDVVVVDHG